MTSQKDISLPFNRLLYGLFILLALYQIAVRQDFIDAASSLGIALVFDPFNPAITWNERPAYQKLWLFIHLGLAAAALGYGVSQN